MENAEFFYKKRSEENPSTTEGEIKEIEDRKEIAEFKNEIAMWDAYTKIGAVEFLGSMTESGMANLFDKKEKTGEMDNIRYELIPERLVEKNGIEYMVYQTTKNYDTKSSDTQEIAQNEYNCYVEIQKKTAEEYESLVEVGKMKRLEITEKENNTLDEKIKEAPCFDEKGNIIEGLQIYYKIID